MVKKPWWILEADAREVITNINTIATEYEAKHGISLADALNNAADKMRENARILRELRQNA